MAPVRLKRGLVLLSSLLIITQYSQSFTPTAARIKTAKIRHTLTNNCRTIVIPANERHANNSGSDIDSHPSPAPVSVHVDVPVGINTNASSSSRTTEQNPNHMNNVDPEAEDHKTNKEIQWLLRTTSKIIGPSLNAPSIGELPSTTIRKCPLIMRAWMKRCSLPHSNAAHVVERLLERLIDERDNGNDNVEKEGVLCTNVYNIVIESWAKTSGKEFQFQSGDVERQLQLEPVPLIGLEPGKDGNVGVAGHDFAAKRANDLLHKMEISTNVQPNEKSYNLVLKALVKSREPSAIDEIARVLDRMEALSAGKNSGVRPTVESYNYYLYALANCETYNAEKDAKKATGLVRELMARGLEDPGSRPDVNTYTQVISILAKTKSVSGAKEAQNIFDDMMKEANATGVYPSTDTFNALMNCWLKSGPKRGRSHIERLLSAMVDLSNDGHEHANPDRFSVNTAISAVAKSNRKDSVRKAYFMLLNMEKTYGVLPDTTSYNLAIDAYAKSRDLQSGRKANNLLSKMEDLYRHGHAELMPDSFSYSTVINAVTTRSDAGKVAESILGRMNHLHQSHGGNIPDTVVYNSVMNAHSTQGDKEWVLRNIAILNYMEESYAAGSEEVKPSIISYNTVLKTFACARGDFTKDAEDLLTRMEGMSTDFAGILPDAISYTSVISSYARSDVKGKAKAAKRILDQMVKAHKAGNARAKPSVFTFNAVLNACAFTFDQREKLDAFIVAVSCLVLLQEYTKPDHTTYGTLLKAWCNLIPKDDERRARAVNSVFRQCCKDGQVGNMVLIQLRYAASPELYCTLIGRNISEQITLSNLPARWSRNVKERYGKIPRMS